jgi:hypothetical protein
VIFGWMVLKRAKKLVSIVSDRVSFQDRRETAFYRIGKMINAEVFCLGYNSDFYKLPEDKRVQLGQYLHELTKDDALIFTHNEFGDYGHQDHKLVYDILITCKHDLLVSSLTNFSGEPSKKMHGEIIFHCNNDLLFYEKCKKIYVDHQCWTWPLPPAIEADVVQKCLI